MRIPLHARASLALALGALALFLGAAAPTFAGPGYSSGSDLSFAAEDSERPAIPAVSASPRATSSSSSTSSSHSGSERKVHFGPQLNWGDDQHFALGLRVAWSVADWHEGLEVIASFDYFFPDDPPLHKAYYFEVNADLAYNFKVGDWLSPYAGAGLDLARIKLKTTVGGVTTSSTDLGVNLLGGLKFESLGSRSVLPFVEGRIELNGGEQFVLTAGVLF